MRFRPIINEAVETLVTAHRHTLANLLHSTGEVCHILLPDSFSENFYRFKRVYKAFGLKGDVLYAVKVNRSNVYLEQCGKHGIGVDVSSIRELRDALCHGIRGNKIFVSGPIKSRSLIELAIRSESTISVDSLDELEKISTVIATQVEGKKLKVLLRVIGLEGNLSRFGMSLDHINKALTFIEDNEGIQLAGFHAHSFSHNLAERIKTTHRQIDMMDMARQRGHDAHILNIGGNYPVSYISKSTWDEFTALDEGAVSELCYESRTPPDGHPNSPTFGHLKLPHLN